MRKAIASLLLSCVAAGGAAQEPAATITLKPLWSTEQFQSSRAPIELSLSRALQLPAERLALMIGTLDVTGVVDVRGQLVRYHPQAIRLPAGESEVTAYLVNASGEWQEIGRFPLRVRTRAGLDAGRAAPTLDLSSTGPLDQRVTPAASLPRRTLQQLTLRAGFEGTMARDGWQITSRANALGATEDAQRLRWSELQGEAPPIDLSDYQVQLERGRARVTLGNVSTGNHRHLLNSFASRGLATTVGFGTFATVNAALMNGTSVVGWSNPLGLDRSAHRLAAASVALELKPSRPGALHIGITGQDGSLLPVASFNQGAVTDAEESRGLGVQVLLSDAQQRIRLSSGFSRSTFDNPTDPLLLGDTTVVAVRATTRTARFGELGLQILRGLPITPSLSASLAASLRHERVDPLYRSVGSSIQADVENNGLELTGALGALSLQGALLEARDNLANIASVLTTRTRSQSASALLPLAALLRADANAWYWPMLQASWQRMRQHGEGLPSNGDFNASHVPDQWSTNQAASVAWTRGSSNLTYRWSESHQDNRQTGRENADFLTNVQSVSLAFLPEPAFSASIDLGKERQVNLEVRSIQRLKRVGGSLQWLLSGNSALSGSLSQSWGRDVLMRQRSQNMEYQLELSQGFTLYRRLESGTQGRLFLRYARTRAALYLFDTSSLLEPRITATLTAGGSLRLY